MSGKYEVWIAIFCIFAAIDRFFPDFSESGKPLRKIGKPLKESESCFRKRKAIEEIGKPLKKSENPSKKIFLDFLEIGKLLKKIEL